MRRLNRCEEFVGILAQKACVVLHGHPSLYPAIEFAAQIFVLLLECMDALLQRAPEHGGFYFRAEVLALQFGIFGNCGLEVIVIERLARHLEALGEPQEVDAVRLGGQLYHPREFCTRGIDQSLAT